MEFGFWLGMIASCLTTLSFLPQVIKTVKTKDTKGISLPMYIMLVTGLIMWLLYGFIYMLIPIIFCNSVTLLLASIILFYKLKESPGMVSQ